MNDSISTGFPSIDKLLGGGLRRGDLTVLGGDVGSGKSALALAIAYRASRRTSRSAFLTAEMRPERVMERLLAIEGRASVDELRMAAEQGDEDPAVSHVKSQLQERAPTVRFFSAGSGPDALVASMRSEGSAHLTVVDNLGAIAASDRAMDDELASAVRKLKSAAVESDTALLLVAGTTAARQDGIPPRPALTHFGAQGAVGQQADVVLGLFREEMYDDGRGIEGAAELHVLKNRHGKTGYADLYYYKMWLRFEDMEE